MLKIFIFVFSCLTSFLVIADDLYVLKSNKDFNISMGKDWLEIPSDVLKNLINNNTKIFNVDQSFEYGYQLGYSSSWFSYPYVLVQVKRGKRIPENQLKQYKTIGFGIKESEELLKNKVGDLLKSLSQGETLYDDVNHLLFYNMSANINSLGKVNGLAVIKLTEYGLIQFIGYSLEQDFSKYELLFRQMAYSITVAEQDVYKPRITDNAPLLFGVNLGEVTVSAIVGALIGVVATIFKFIMRKKTASKADNG